MRTYQLVLFVFQFLFFLFSYNKNNIIYTIEYIVKVEGKTQIASQQQQTKKSFDNPRR